MLEGMATRGRDSAGLAAYTEEVEEDARKFSLYSLMATPTGTPSRTGCKSTSAAR